MHLDIVAVILMLLLVGLVANTIGTLANTWNITQLRRRLRLYFGGNSGI